MTTTTGSHGVIDPDPPPQPIPDPDSAGFWDAAADGRLAMSRCQTCGLWMHPPLERCRDCGGPTAFEEVSGDGTLSSFIVVHQPAVPGYRDKVPYLLGLIELVEQRGLRLVTRLEGVEPDQLSDGQPMRARLVAHEGGEFSVPVFHPVGET